MEYSNTTISSNGSDARYAKAGDKITISTTTNKVLGSGNEPTLSAFTIGGKAPKSTTTNNFTLKIPTTSTYEATYTVHASDGVGTDDQVSFSITASDSIGNTKTITSSNLSDSTSAVYDSGFLNVIVDTVAPTLVEADVDWISTTYINTKTPNFDISAPSESGRLSISGTSGCEFTSSTDTSVTKDTAKAFTLKSLFDGTYHL